MSTRDDAKETIPELKNTNRTDEIVAESADLGTAITWLAVTGATLGIAFVILTYLDWSLTTTAVGVSVAAWIGLLVLALKTNNRRTELLRELHVINLDQENLATHDPLTDVYNRRFFEEIYRLEREKAFRFETPTSLIMMDVDHFKLVNDTHGHLTGDEVLKEVAKRLTDSLRASDVVCRYGGEEFVILLPATDSESAREFAEVLRMRMEGDSVSEHELTVTASFGVATSEHNDSVDVSALIRSADSAVYEAKHSGRNCVRVSS